MKPRDTEMELDVGCREGTWKQPKFCPRKPLPSFTEMAVQTAIGLIAISVIIAAGVLAWIDATPK